MKNRNCPNCGAALDNEKVKCPYCGTSYYDLSAIPLNEPFVLTINVGTECVPKIVTSKVICTRVDVTMNPQIAYSFSPGVTYNMEF